MAENATKASSHTTVNQIGQLRHHWMGMFATTTIGNLYCSVSKSTLEVLTNLKGHHFWNCNQYKGKSLFTKQNSFLPKDNIAHLFCPQSTFVLKDIHFSVYVMWLLLLSRCQAIRQTRKQRVFFLVLRITWRRRHYSQRHKDCKIICGRQQPFAGKHVCLISTEQGVCNEINNQLRHGIAPHNI